MFSCCRKNTGDTKPSHVLDLLDVNLGETSPVNQADPWGLPQAPPPQVCKYIVNEIKSTLELSNSLCSYNPCSFQLIHLSNIFQ